MTSGPAITHAGDLAALLTNLAQGDVLFIDEIHRLNATVEEVLYPAMEDFALDIIIGKGPSARSIRLDLPKFTLIGATTRMGLLTSPLRDRFGIKEQLAMYDADSLREIIVRSAHILGIEITDEGAVEIGSRARERRVLQTGSCGACATMRRCAWRAASTLPRQGRASTCSAWTSLGWTKSTAGCCDVMITKFGGRPVGLDTIAAATGEDATTIEDVYEPYLLRLGFIARTPRGRIVMPRDTRTLDMRIKRRRRNSYDWRWTNEPQGDEDAA